MQSQNSEGNLLERLGGRAVGAVKGLLQLITTLMAALTAARASGAGARAVVGKMVVRQIFYTSFQAVGMTSLMALLVGATLVAQTELLGGALHRETAGRIMIAVILREVAPLVTAFIVIGRSGTAIATELGIMRVNHEVLALASLGIDPPRVLVWPRLVACTVSVPLLSIFFSAAAVLGGLLVAFFMDSHGIADWRHGVSMGLTAWDLPLLAVKSAGLGALIGWLCCHYGLSVGMSPTEVPQKASTAVVRTLLACISYNAIATVVFYWLVGAKLT